MIRPTWAGANNAPAMGTPLARLFFDPQKTRTVSSLVENPPSRAPNVVSTRTMTRNNMSRPVIKARSKPDRRCHKDRKGVVQGKSVYVSVETGGRRSIKKNKHN